MKRSVAATIFAAIIAQFGIAGGPAAAASNDNPAARLAAVEKEIAALRKENKALRAQQARRETQDANASVPAEPTRPASARTAPGPAAAIPVATRAPIYAAVPPAAGSWTGFYIGANVGLSVGRSPTTHSDAFLSSPTEVGSDRFALSPFGAIGGGQIGFNWQPAANWVFGVEADLQGSGERDSACVFQCSVPGAIPTIPDFIRHAIMTQQLDWFGTVRGRAGWTNGPVLIYGTAGLAYGRVRTDVAFMDFNFGASRSASTSAVETKSGWAAGFGAEAQLAGNWTGRIEYLYIDLGGVGASGFVIPFTPTVSEGHQFGSTFRDHVVRLALNYKFGDPVYVAAGPGGGMIYKAPPAMAPAFNWSGLYLGANIGLSVARNPTTTPLTTINNTTGVTQLFDMESFKLSPSGGIGGGQIGYNWHAAPNWVFGIEADLQGSGQRDSVCLNCVVITAEGPIGTTLTQRIDWFGTLRARAGWTNGPVLFYATGGLAYGHISTDEIVQTIPFLTSVTTAGSFSQIKTGWTAGGGIEARLFGNWTGKVEYLYMDLGDVSGNVIAPQTVIPLNVNPNNVNISENRGFNSSVRDHIVRIGVNYKFGPEAVVARY